MRVSKVALVVKNVPANAGDIRDRGLIPESGRPTGEGHVNPLQYSCQGNPMDRGTWQATVRGVTESLTQLLLLPQAQRSSWILNKAYSCLYTKKKRNMVNYQQLVEIYKIRGSRPDDLQRNNY